MTPTPQMILGWAGPALILIGLLVAGALGNPALGSSIAATGVLCLIAWAVTASITERLDHLAMVIIELDDDGAEVQE